MSGPARKCHANPAHTTNSTTAAALIDQRALYDAAADNLEISHVNASHLVLSQYDLVTMANATLHEIISHIETTYGVRISVPGRYGDKRYAFNYQRSNSLEEVLNIVEYMTGEHCEVIFRQK